LKKQIAYTDGFIYANGNKPAPTATYADDPTRMTAVGIADSLSRLYQRRLAIFV
jgi:hypothetical protein